MRLLKITAKLPFYVLGLILALLGYAVATTGKYICGAGSYLLDQEDHWVAYGKLVDSKLKELDSEEL